MKPPTSLQTPVISKAELLKLISEFLDKIKYGTVQVKKIDSEFIYSQVEDIKYKISK